MSHGGGLTRCARTSCRFGWSRWKLAVSFAKPQSSSFRQHLLLEVQRPGPLERLTRAVRDALRRVRLVGLDALEEHAPVRNELHLAIEQPDDALFVIRRSR